jgi:hypothetical protein
MNSLSQLSSQGSATATSPEMEVLLCCARTNMNPLTIERVKGLLKQDIDFMALIGLADRHRVKPLLYHNLNKYAPESIPLSYLQQMQTECRNNSWRNMYLTKELVGILELLEVNGIKAISFKGPVLAASAYGNLSLRQISDLDFLVEEYNFQKAVDLLVAQGYEVMIEVPWEFHLKSSDRAYSIDLHREIVPKHLSCSLSSNYIWENLQTFSLFGTTILNLTPEACLLILCLNGTKDYWQRLNRICDIAELIHANPDLNWQQILEQAEKMGFKRLIFLSLFLARNFLDAEIPDFIWQQVQSDPVVNSLVLLVYKKLFSQTWESSGTVETTLFHIKTRERWQDKAQSFFGLMLLSGWLHPTERDRDVIPLPALLSFLYYLIRPIRILNRYKSILFDYFRN